MFCQTLETSINDAFSNAADNQHKFVTLEHLLLALLDNPDASGPNKMPIFFRNFGY